jgi:hypothetical protein
MFEGYFWRGRWVRCCAASSRAACKENLGCIAAGWGVPAALRVVIGPFDSLPREPKARVHRPASGWWTNAKFHGPG